MDVFRAHELIPLTLEPNLVDSGSARRLLVVALDELGSLGVAELERLSAWMQVQPIPIIGLGPINGSPLVSGVDLIVEDSQDLQHIARKIDKNPQAAAILVQVLRSTLGISISQGLVLESLAYATLQGGEEFAMWLKGYRAINRDKVTRAEREHPVVLDRRGDRLDIVLNSPADRNALSIFMRDALTEAFKLVAVDGCITTVNVSANGPCFCAGGDLSEFGTVEDLSLSHQVRMLRMPAQYLAPHAERYAFHVHRACIGAGIEMPAFARRLTATPDTVFQLPEVNMGLLPGAGGCVSIPRRIGRHRTAYLAILGEPIGADLALDWGLIDSIED